MGILDDPSWSPHPKILCLECGITIRECNCPDEVKEISFEWCIDCKRKFIANPTSDEELFKEFFK